VAGATMPLAMATPGELVRIVGIRGGLGLGRRLADMGLVPGTDVRIMSGGRPGPVLLEARGTKLAIGHGVAQKIMVAR
jgi:ferrous iron transport protein A